MKISGTGSSSPASARKAGKTQRSSDARFSDHLGAAESVEGSELSGIDGASALSSLETLLAMQAVNPDEDGKARKRLVRRGEDLLDQLEDIRRGLLLGTIPSDRLTSLAHMARSKREAGADPELAAILDEIELRAEVELAKLSRP